MNKANYDELIQRIQALPAYPASLYEGLRRFAVLPAPSGCEKARCAWAGEALAAEGVGTVRIDRAGNLIIPFGSGDGPVSVFMAHSDVVFPDTDCLPWREDETYIYCPGIGDNDVHAAAIAAAAVFLTRQGIRPEKGTLLLVINSGEEGLGNLKGAREIARAYRGRIREMVTFDSVIPTVINRAVGSRRWRIEVSTAGGHSYTAFGNPNAIEKLAALIEKLYRQALPSEGVTTYNVGLIEGGTSVNTIAQNASMLYECRSDNGASLDRMTAQLEALIREEERAGDAVWQLSLIGERPCMGDVDAEAMADLTARAASAVRQWYGEEPSYTAGSTDANVFLAAGIPSVCVGCCRGEGTHTREEKVRKDSLLPGLQLALAMILDSVRRLDEV